MASNWGMEVLMPNASRFQIAERSQEVFCCGNLANSEKWRSTATWSLLVQVAIRVCVVDLSVSAGRFVRLGSPVVCASVPFLLPLALLAPWFPFFPPA